MEEILGRYALTVKFREGKELLIPGEKIDYHYVADGSLDSLMENQKLYLWGLGLYRDTLYEISEQKEYSEEKLLAIIDSTPQMKEENMTEPQDACLGYEDGKFVVTPEVEGTTLDPELARKTILGAIREEKESVDLAGTEGIYSSPEIRKDDEDLGDEAAQRNELAGARIVYELPGGETKVLDGPVLKEWLEVDKDYWNGREE
jgi:hypothetical protein